MLRSFLCLLLFAQGPKSFAGHAEGGMSNPHDNVVICERLLAPEESEARMKILAESMLGRPYILSTAHDMTERGLVRMGLDPKTSNRAIRDLVLVVEREQGILTAKLLRYANGGFKTIQRFELTDSQPHGYRSIWIPDEKLKLSYAQLLKEFPEAETQGRNRGDGFHTKPDQDGVRRFILFLKERSSRDSISSTITLGLDVPHARSQAERYSTDLGEVTSDLRSPDRNYIRIDVLTFVRAHDDIYD